MAIPETNCFQRVIQRGLKLKTNAVHIFIEYHSVCGVAVNEKQEVQAVASIPTWHNGFLGIVVDMVKEVYGQWKNRNNGTLDSDSDDENMHSDEKELLKTEIGVVWEKVEGIVGSFMQSSEVRFQ